MKRRSSPVVVAERYRRRLSQTSADAAIDRLKDRYVRGEITFEAFEARVDLLLSPPSAVASTPPTIV